MSVGLLSAWTCDATTALNNDVLLGRKKQEGWPSQVKTSTAITAPIREFSMPAQSLKSIFKAVIRESVTEPLKACGFAKSDWLYTRRVKNLTHAVHVQLHNQNDDLERGFTVNIGVIVDGWAEIVHAKWIRKDPGILNFPHMGPVHTRLGYLAGHENDLWWTVHKPGKFIFRAIFGRTDHGAEVVSEVNMLLRTYGVTWLDSFQDVNGLVEWLVHNPEACEKLLWPFSKYPKMWTLGVLFHLAGQPDAAREHFDKAIDISESSQWTAPGEPGAFARDLRKQIFGD